MKKRDGKAWRRRATHRRRHVSTPKVRCERWRDGAATVDASYVLPCRQCILLMPLLYAHRRDVMYTHDKLLCRWPRKKKTRPRFCIHFSPRNCLHGKMRTGNGPHITCRPVGSTATDPLGIRLLLFWGRPPASLPGLFPDSGTLYTGRCLSACSNPELKRFFVYTW